MVCNLGQSIANAAPMAAGHHTHNQGTPPSWLGQEAHDRPRELKAIRFSSTQMAVSRPSTRARKRRCDGVPQPLSCRIPRGRVDSSISTAREVRPTITHYTKHIHIKTPDPFSCSLCQIHLHWGGPGGLCATSPQCLFCCGMIRFATGFERDEIGLKLEMEFTEVVAESGPVVEFRRTELRCT